MANKPFLLTVITVTFFIAIVLGISFMALDDASMNSGNAANQNSFLNIVTILVGFAFVASIGVGCWAGVEVYRTSKEVPPEDQSEDDSTEETKNVPKVNRKSKETTTARKPSDQKIKKPTEQKQQNMSRSNLRMANEQQAKSIEYQLPTESAIKDQNALSALVSFEQ